jgi:hypothetical protein
MKKKLVSFDDSLYKEIEKRAELNRRPLNTEIIIAVENHLKRKP